MANAHGCTMQAVCVSYHVKPLGNGRKEMKTGNI